MSIDNSTLKKLARSQNKITDFIYKTQIEDDLTDSELAYITCKISNILTTIELVEKISAKLNA